MITIECPLCAGEADTDEALTILICDGCGISPAITPDPIVALEAVA